MRGTGVEDGATPAQSPALSLVQISCAARLARLSQGDGLSRVDLSPAFCSLFLLFSSLWVSTFLGMDCAVELSAILFSP